MPYAPKSRKMFGRKKDSKWPVASNLFFVPGVFFICLAVALLAAPQIVMGLVAGFFLFLGIVLSIAAWRFLRLKKQLEIALKKLDGRVVIQGMSMQNPLDFEEVEEKKIIFH